jgi:hypothetical protein
METYTLEPLEHILLVLFMAGIFRMMLSRSAADNWYLVYFWAAYHAADFLTWGAITFMFLVLSFMAIFVEGFDK